MWSPAPGTMTTSCRLLLAGIVSGYPDGTFKPGNSVTRRDFAIMLTQMLGVSNDGTAVSPLH